jgi:septation ring formation regulator EzrA
MPLVLAPSFDDHTREEVEAHLEMVRTRRLAGALEYQQSKMLRLEKDNNNVTNKLIRNYEQLGKALNRLDRELEKIEAYLQQCQMLRSEADLTMDRIALAKRK